MAIYFERNVILNFQKAVKNLNKNQKLTNVHTGKMNLTSNIQQIGQGDDRLQSIVQKLIEQEPLSADDGLALYEHYPLKTLKKLANWKKESLHQNKVFYNRNIHLEPTNRCVYSCKFCSFYRPAKNPHAAGAWDYSIADIDQLLESYYLDQITEIHITGGVHPDHGLDWHVQLIEHLKAKAPHVHLKAYTAVEVMFMARKSRKTFRDTLLTLKKAGVASLPGGGAEIFNPEVRRKIAGGKAPAHHWLEIHKAAHQIGLSSNATMLYGHVESFEDRIHHILQIRNLQEETGGFHAFIPLKYRHAHNELSYLAELDETDDLRNYAVCRLMLHNVKHLKTYWVMLGLETAEKSLYYGVDDFDGTIKDTTKIYSMAGSIKNPTLSVQDICSLIERNQLISVERNSVYQEI